MDARRTLLESYVERALRVYTLTTELNVPNELYARSPALGSSCQFPLTMKRYSCCPADRFIQVRHVPFLSQRSGRTWGFQSLNVPAINTSFASGRAGQN